MIDVNEILNGPKKEKQRKDKDFFDMNKIFPKKEKTEEIIPKEKEQKIIVNNYYYQVPNMQKDRKSVV